MDDNRTIFHMDVCKNFPDWLEEIRELNNDCFDGLIDLAMKETLEQFDVKDEKEIPENKRQDFSMAIYNNRYVRLSHQISALIDSSLFYGKYTTGSRYGDLFL